MLKTISGYSVQWSIKTKAAHMAGELKIIWHGDSDEDIAVIISLDTFRKLAAWLLAAEHPEPMSLREAEIMAIPLLMQMAEALIVAGYDHEAGRAMWAATALRNEAERTDGTIETDVNR